MKSSSLRVLYKKELADNLHSQRFIIILLLVAITGLSSIFTAAYGMRDATDNSNNDFIFLQLFTTSSGSIPSFTAFMSFLGPLTGLALGFDAINNEVNRGTLSKLLAQPIPRDAVINGKFLAGVSVLSIMVFSLGLAISSIGIIAFGIPPTFEELMRIFVFLLITILYMSLWLAVSQMFSLFFRQSATSALACIALWLFLTVFAKLLAGVIADAVYPVSSYSVLNNALKNANMKLMLNRISPSTLYNECSIYLLKPTVRTTSFVTERDLIGAVAGALPLTQSILLLWPHLITMAALTMISFAVSYINFMSKEIRA